MFHLHLRKHINLCRRFCNIKLPLKSTEKKYLVPRKPVPSKIHSTKLPPRTKIDADTIAHLERLSLVDCANKQGIQTLEDAIAFADQILQVDTKGVEPLVTVLEDRPLQVREDEITEGNCRKDILSNASLTEEEYFVAPPGNIPLEPRKNLLHEEEPIEMCLKKILDLCERQGFAKRFMNKGFDNVVNELLRIAPTGALLQENLKMEWFFNMVISRENTIFLSKDSFADAYEYAKEMCQEKLPFGVAEVAQSGGEDENTNVDFGFDRYFVEESPCLLNTTIFVSPSKSTQFFHQWQRQRRMWWRKFSASPGRYHLTDIQSNNGCQSVEIKAEYSWGAQLIESLMLSNGTHLKLDSDQLQMKDGRKKVQAHFITSSISLSSMVLNTLCDAYDEVQTQAVPRPMLRLHRKLAPYKISFSVVASQAAVTEELSQLALYLCRKLRSDHISSLLLPRATKNSLESQYKDYDELGIPYTVVLNENTLKNGIAFLRNRDTTLKEQVHVSSLPAYVQKLFKNY